MRDRCVLDACVTLAWGLPDERDPYSMSVLAWLTAPGRSVVVPPSWRAEVLNVLWVAEKRGRMPLADTDEFIEGLARSAILVDSADSVNVSRSILGFSRAHNLAAYDAAYLELAIRHGLPLATTDGALLRAMRAVGVPLLRP